MDQQDTNAYIEMLRRRCEVVSGQQTTVDDVKEMIIEHLKQRKIQAVEEHFRKMTLEHLVHLLAADPTHDDN
jgi:hypothetical protein